MKTKIFLVIMTVFLMSGTMMAQQRQRGEHKDISPKERAERMTERMVKEYSLTDEQKQQLLEVNLQWMEQRKDRPNMGNRPRMQMKGDHKAHRDSTKQQPDEKPRLDRKAMMEKMQADRKAYEEKLQQILTKEQYEAYTKNMQEQRERPRRR